MAQLFQLILKRLNVFKIMSFDEVVPLAKLGSN